MLRLLLILATAAAATTVAVRTVVFESRNWSDCTSSSANASRWPPNSQSVDTAAIIHWKRSSPSSNNNTRRSKIYSSSSSSSSTAAAASAASPATATTNNNSSNTNTAEQLRDAVAQQQVAWKLRQIRQRQCLAAAYRLAGISVFAVPDRDILALRLDVMSACYHCFFDVVLEQQQQPTNESDDKDNNNKKGGDTLYLRLVQHTLPAAIPLAAILQRHLGGVAEIGPLEAEEASRSTSSSWPVQDLLQRLRACANQIYHACHCLAVRNETIEFLKSIAATSTAPTTATTTNHNNKSPSQPSASLLKKRSRHQLQGTSTTNSLEATTNQETATTPSTQQQQSPPPPPEQQPHPVLPYTLDHLECNSSGIHTKISFHLHHRLSGIAVAAVTLQYPADLCRQRAQQPVHVSIRTSRREVDAVTTTANDDQQQQQQLKRCRRSKTTKTMMTNTTNLSRVPCSPFGGCRFGKRSRKWPTPWPSGSTSQHAGGVLSGHLLLLGFLLSLSLPVLLIIGGISSTS